MGNFSFSATAECDICGAYLSSSDEECDHGGQTIDTYIFRRLREGRESIVGVKSVNSQMWYELKEKVGDDWIAYQYIGPKDWVNQCLKRGTWDSIEDFPVRAMSLDAPKDINSDDE